LFAEVGKTAVEPNLTGVLVEFHGPASSSIAASTRPLSGMRFARLWWASAENGSAAIAPARSSMARSMKPLLLNAIALLKKALAERGLIASASVKSAMALG